MYRLRSDGARPPRGGQRGPLRRGPRAEATDGHGAEAAAGPPRHEDGEACRPAQEADRGEGRRPVRAPPPVRAAPAHRLRAGDPATDHPRVAATPHAPRADGGGLSALRPAVPDSHGPGQARRPAGAVEAVRPAARGAEEAPGAGPGEGAGVLGRAAVGDDVEGGGPGADAAGDRGPAGAGPAAGAAGRWPGQNNQGPAQGESGVIRSPGFLATVWGFAKWASAGKTKPQIAILAIETPGKTWGHPGPVDHVMM